MVTQVSTAFELKEPVEATAIFNGAIFAVEGGSEGVRSNRPVTRRRRAPSSTSRRLSRLRGASGNAVEDITLSIREGEFIAIVGPSGCGKSTFMKLATGLPPTQGTVLVEGGQVAGPLKIVGMAFQAPTLLPWRTTIDNVLLPLEIVEPYARLQRDRAKYADWRARC